MATIIYPDGSREITLPKHGTFTLEEMYAILDCSLVQPVYLADERVMWIDEEGKLKPHQVNERATQLLHEAGGMLHDYIAGTALITKNHEVD
jgi:Domain of unknown function (DUF3846)